MSEIRVQMPNIRVHIFYRDFRFWFSQGNKEYYVNLPNELVSALDVFGMLNELEKVVDFPAEVKGSYGLGVVAVNSIKYEIIIPDDIFESL